MNLHLYQHNSVWIRIQESHINADSYGSESRKLPEYRLLFGVGLLVLESGLGWLFRLVLGPLLLFRYGNGGVQCGIQLLARRAASKEFTQTPLKTNKNKMII